jgi:hypothetical protein
MVQELEELATNIDALLPLFVNGGSMSGLFLPSEHQAHFKSFVLDSQDIIEAELGHSNKFSMNLIHTVNTGCGGFSGGPSYACAQEVSAILRVAAKAIQRKKSNTPPSTSAAKPYVDPDRIQVLRDMPAVRWDFTRLIELCREINVASANQCHMSTAMLLRAILDHIPPVFGLKTFAEVASNYGGPKENRSFKSNMKRLEDSLRNIADMHLHSKIRQREDVPTATQVDFAADLDVLLGEVIRVAHAPRNEGA